MRWIFFLSFVVCANMTFGQSENDSIPPTNSTTIDAKFDKKKERPEGTRHYMTIIKKDTKNILYGNKCFEDYTRQLGFIYEVQMKGHAGSMKSFSRFWHNAATKTALCFKAGPWWKARVNKRRKECRTSSGDFVG